MQGALHIGRLAALVGRSAHAIRWYEAQGLIPGVARDRGGRRVYDPRLVQWLALLERLRLTGMSIADMRRYADLVRQGRVTLAERQELLSAHRGEVERTLADWRRALKLIDRKVEFYNEWLATGKRPPEIEASSPDRPVGRKRIRARKLTPSPAPAARPPSRGSAD